MSNSQSCHCDSALKRVLPGRLGGWGSGHAPAGVLPLPGRGHRLPERARPSPGKPGPRPRPLFAAAAPTLPARGWGAGAAGIAATGGSRSTGRGVSAPTGEAPGLASQGGTARAKRVGFRLCPSRPLQSLGDRPVEAGRDRACPGTPWREDWGLHCLSISLLATSFLYVSSVEAHSHHLLSIRVPIVRVRKLRPTDLQQLAKDL